MIQNLYKKIVGFILIISFVLPSIIIPQTAKAQWATFDAGNIAASFANLAENAADAVASVGSEISTYLLQFKEYVLDTLVHTLIQQIIRQIGQDVINWINSGFQGSPAFVQDPGAFFLDLADQMTGAFIDGADGPLKSLCSPFSIDLKIALAFKYHPKGAGKRYDCTLGTIIKNSRNAINNASINGFTAGDFRQGGWPAFVSMTTEPQNNIYGAFLETDSELTLKVGGIQSQKKDELMQGGGFLSYPDPTCAKKAKDTAKAVNDGADIGVGTNDLDNNLVTYNEKKDTFVANTASCPTVTPGSQISDTMKQNVAAGSNAAVAADEVGEIVDALIAQLATQILKFGVTAISQKDSSGSSYYNNQVTQLEDQKAADDLKASALSKMPEFIQTTKNYKTNIDNSLSFVTGINNTYKLVKECYERKIASDPPELWANEVTIANSRIANIVAILAGDLAATTTRLVNQDNDAQDKLNKLYEIQASTTAAKNVLELQGPTQAYTSMVRSGQITTIIDVKNTKKDYDDLIVNYENTKNDAVSKLNECSGFPGNIRYSGM